MRLLTLLLLLLPTFLAAQELSIADRIEALADELHLERNGNGPGAYVAAVQHEQDIFQRGYGFASVEHRVPVTDSTIFDLASLAKMFTGYAIATLEIEGKLRVEADITTYLPDFPDLGQRITVAHLLHHTSGIKNWTQLLYQAGYHYSNRIQFDHLLRLIYAQRDLDFLPGERYRYSNSGYVLLARIIENVTEVSYADWMREHVFDPLGMDHTFFHDTPGRVIPNVARGYFLDQERETVRDFDNTTVVGSSSLFSSGPDMQRWLNFLLHPGPESKPVIDRMLTTRPLNDGTVNTYAYGITVEDYRGTKMIGHSGSWASYTSYLFLLPEFDAGIFFVHNFRTYTSGIARDFADLFLPEQAETASEARSGYHRDNLPNETVATAVLDRYVGKYKLGIGWYLDIIRDGEKVYAQANGEPAFLMYAADDTTFVVPNYGYRTITFLENEAGEIDALIYNEKRRERHPELFNYDLDALRPYAGTYYNHELGLVFNFEFINDGFYATNVNFPPAEIIAVEPNEFISDGKLRTLRFTRDANGEVDGFHTVNSRGEKIWSYLRAR